MPEIDWDKREARYEYLAGNYEAMAMAVERNDLQAIGYLPKVIPRGRTVDYYRSKALSYQQKVDECNERFREKMQVDEIARLMAMPPTERAEHEQWIAELHLDWIRDLLRDLPLKDHLAVMKELLDETRLRCEEEGNWDTDFQAL